jgi:hypothetical protein
MRFALLAALALTTAACASERTARLYPSNDAASKDGLINVTYTDTGMGHGPISFSMPNGERIKGEYSTQDTASYGFGSILALAGNTVSTASGTSMRVPGSMPGTISAIGERGTRIECEYFVNVSTSAGSGACKSSTGAIYRLHFGGAA